jgi:hypothetical protein
MNEYDLDFDTLYGAGTGAGAAQGSSDIMSYFWDLLQQSKQVPEAWENQSWMDVGAGATGLEQGYGLEQYQDYLSSFGEGEFKDTATLLSSMIGGSGLVDLTKGYGQDVGDISSEFGAQLQGLQKGYTTKGKAGRYGQIGTGGRNVGMGGRSKYMSDIYGLEQKQHEMQQGLQDKFSSDFYGNLATWQGLHPAPLQ